MKATVKIPLSDISNEEIPMLQARVSLLKSQIADATIKVHELENIINHVPYYVYDSTVIEISEEVTNTDNPAAIKIYVGNRPTYIHLSNIINITK